MEREISRERNSEKRKEEDWEISKTEEGKMKRENFERKIEGEKKKEERE